MFSRIDDKRVGAEQKWEYKDQFTQMKQVYSVTREEKHGLFEYINIVEDYEPNSSLKIRRDQAFFIRNP